MPASLGVVPTGTVGARVEGVDLRSVGAAEFEAIMRAWTRHDVLVFPRQTLTEGAGRKSPQGYPEVYVVSNVLDGRDEPIGALGDGEALWHTDMSYAALPPDASMLYALELPAAGGDTCFASMKAALERVPAALRRRIASLDIKHDGTYDSGGNLRKGLSPSADPRSSVGTPHPVVIEHPVSGAHALYLGRRRNAWVVGLEPEESERLLDELWACVEASVYRHEWSLGDLVLWDNRTTMHRRDAFDPRSRRVMHRTQIKGSCAPRRAAVAA
jgi:taurine dioxygenase